MSGTFWNEKFRLIVVWDLYSVQNLIMSIMQIELKFALMQRLHFVLDIAGVRF